MKLTIHAHLDPHERSLLREALSPFRELPPERHWAGAMAELSIDAPLTRESIEGMISVARELASLPSTEINPEAVNDAIEFLAKVLSLLDRCSSYTRTETHALVQDLMPLELDPLPSSGVAPHQVR